MIARVFLNHPEKANEVTLDEEYEPTFTGDPVFDEMERLFWRGDDPFKGKKLKDLLKFRKREKIELDGDTLYGPDGADNVDGAGDTDNNSVRII